MLEKRAPENKRVPQNFPPDRWKLKIILYEFLSDLAEALRRISDFLDFFDFLLIIHIFQIQK